MISAKKKFTKNRYTLVRLIIISLLAISLSPFILHDHTPTGLWLLSGLAVYILFEAIYTREYRKLYWLILNPIIALPFYYSTTAVINCGLSQPKIIQCTYHIERNDAGEALTLYDQEFNIPIELWNDDCDWDNLYSVTADVNNWVTKELLSPRQE